MKIRTFATCFVGCLCALMVGGAIWAASTFTRVLAEYDRHIAQDKAVDAHVAEVQALVLDLETGVRGWQITGDPAFREPYDRSDRERQAATRALVASRDDDPVEMRLAEHVHDQLLEWDTDVAVPLLALPAGGNGRPEYLALTRDGKRRIDDIRINLAALRAGKEKRQVLAEATLRSCRRDIWTNTLVVVVAALTALIVVWLRAATALRRAIEQLLEHVRRMTAGEFTAVKVHSVTEVEALAHALSSMAVQLAAERERERRFGHLGAALAKGGNVDSVAETALDLLIENSAAIGGMLWLARDGEVEPAAVVGVEPAELSGAGQRRAHDVARSGRLLRVSVEEEGSRASMLGSVRLVVPIAAGPSVIGVVEIIGASFSASGLEDDLLRSSTRIGLALQRAIDAARTEALTRALAEQRQRLETIFEALVDAVMLLDEAGNVQIANPAARKLFGRGVTDRNIDQLSDVQQVQCADGSPLRPDQTIRATCLVRGEQLHDVVRRIVCADGGGRIFTINGVPILQGERPIGVVAVFHDITEEHALREHVARANERLRKQNEELASQQEELHAQAEELVKGQAQLALRNEQLAHSSRLKSDFLASMSHELRTPLNAVIGFSDLLLAGDYGAVDANQQGVLRDVLSAGNQLLTLINDVLDLSKIEAGRIETRAARVDIAEAMTHACHLLASAARTRFVTVSSLAATGTLFALADPDRLRQVLLNLVSNAVKFTPEQGSVTLDASIQGGKLHISVSDTGIGISPSDAEKLFVPFSQIDSGYTRRFQGTGLGLSISKQLVELMGGQIGFTSAPGEGSVFFFTLPVASRVRLTPAAGMRAVRTSIPPIIASPRGSRPMVLLVEDEEPDGRFIQLVIEQGGFNVVRAHDAESALAIVAAERPALMVIDLGLPGLSGDALIEQLRAREELREIPIAVLSGRDLSRDDQARLTPLVQDILQKGTLSRAELLQKLAALCPPRRPSGAVRVLVIDDTMLNRKLLRAMLQGPECEVLEAPDGPSGIEAARDQAPTVILMDMQMPGMDGLTATMQLKADDRTRGIPVIAVTAHAMSGDAERMLAAGCVGYVSKPISRTKLDEALGVALGEDVWRSCVGSPTTVD